MSDIATHRPSEAATNLLVTYQSVLQQTVIKERLEAMASLLTFLNWSPADMRWLAEQLRLLVQRQRLHGVLAAELSDNASNLEFLAAQKEGEEQPDRKRPLTAAYVIEMLVNASTAYSLKNPETSQTLFWVIEELVAMLQSNAVDPVEVPALQRAIRGALRLEGLQNDMRFTLRRLLLAVGGEDPDSLLSEPSEE